MKRPPSRSRWAGRLLVVVLWAAAGCEDLPTALGDEPAIPVTLTVHLLRSGLEDLDATLTESEIARLFKTVNGIWKQARVTWIVQAVREDSFIDPTALTSTPSDSLDAETVFFQVPIADTTGATWHVYVAGTLGGGAPGAYLPGRGAVLVGERDGTGNRDLDGSVGLVLAHELGHSLGLGHVACERPGNLMAPNCPWSEQTRLTAAQIQNARAQANRGRPADRP